MNGRRRGRPVVWGYWAYDVVRRQFGEGAVTLTPAERYCRCGWTGVAPAQVREP